MAQSSRTLLLKGYLTVSNEAHTFRVLRKVDPPGGLLLHVTVTNLAVDSWLEKSNPLSDRRDPRTTSVTPWLQHAESICGRILNWRSHELATVITEATFVVTVASFRLHVYNRDDFGDSFDARISNPRMRTRARAKNRSEYS